MAIIGGDVSLWDEVASGVKKLITLLIGFLVSKTIYKN